LQGVYKDPQWKTGTIYQLDYTSWVDGLPDSMRLHPVQFKLPGDRQRQFHPLGINVRGRSLFIVNHDPDGPSIEQLELSEDGRSANHKRSIKHELLHAPNSIAVLSETELLVTNDHHFPPHANKPLNQLETYLAIPSGNVVHFDLASNKATALVSLPYSNGIALLNETCVAVSSTSTPGVYIYSMDPSSRALTYAKVLRTPFFVDNLSVDKAGHLIAAGHPHPGPVEKVAHHRAMYALDDGLPDGETRPRAGSYVTQWNGDDESTERTLYSGSKEFISSASAGRDATRGFGFVTGLYAQGILFFRD
jgi:arylesterase / paraoxonase